MKASLSYYSLGKSWLFKSNGRYHLFELWVSQDSPMPSSSEGFLQTLLYVVTCSVEDFRVGLEVIQGRGNLNFE